MTTQWLRNIIARRRGQAAQAHRVRQDHARRRNRFHSAVEHLEERTLLAVTGVPWLDPGHLTLSFAPDGTRIAAHQSNLFDALDAQTPTADWQREILRAFQTWASHANVNVSFEPDSGAEFGTPGPTQGDARFGDIRIGARPMSAEVLSVSVPHDPFLSGTWAGDVLLNSSYAFDASDADLFSTMLHEAGHVLGLGHSADPNSVMFSHANRVHTGLSAGDIAAIQALYGTRSPDPHESERDNDSILTAKRIEYSDSDGSVPLIVYGDISSASDADFFWLRPLERYTGPLTFRVQTAGVSLLAPRLTVYDQSGTILGQANSTGEFGSVLSVRLERVNPSARYYAKVEGAGAGAFGTGGFALAATFDANLTATPEAIDAVLRGPYEYLRPDAFDEVFSSPAGVWGDADDDDDDAHVESVAEEHAVAQEHADDHDEPHEVDTPDNVRELRATPVFSRGLHYAARATLAQAADVHTYRVKSLAAPSGETVFLTATVQADGASGAVTRVTILDGDRNPVAADVLANGNGRYTIQVPDAKPDTDYFLTVHSPALDAANYTLTVDSDRTATSLQTFISSSLDDTATETVGTLYVAQNQLFHLLLAADSATADAGAAVRMTIYDSAGTAVFSLTAAAGEAVSGPSLLLAPGAYSVRFQVIPPAGGPVGPINFKLAGASLSDPIGPIVDDPTEDPEYTCGDPAIFCYPGGRVSPDPFFWDWLPA
jgi:predicted Zn-dependent protease